MMLENGLKRMNLSWRHKIETKGEEEWIKRPKKEMNVNSNTTSRLLKKQPQVCLATTSICSEKAKEYKPLNKSSSINCLKALALAPKSKLPITISWREEIINLRHSFSLNYLLKQEEIIVDLCPIEDDMFISERDSL